MGAVSEEFLARLREAGIDPHPDWLRERGPELAAQLLRRVYLDDAAVRESWGSRRLPPLWENVP